MKASQIRSWPDAFKPTEWPIGTPDKMDAVLFTEGVFKLRYLSNTPMSPSSLYEAHVRDEGNSRHSTKGNTRLSDATDLHVSTYEQMIHCFSVAQSIQLIGGIGIYFDTNKPLIHIDMRPQRLCWVRTSEGEYIYRENNYALFYKVLAQELEKKGL